MFEGPEYFDRDLGQSSSVVCSIYAPGYDDNFHMYVNGIHTSDLCEAGSPWCRAGFYNATWTYDDGTVETYVHGEVDRLTLAHNDTIIKCVSYKYDKELYARIILHSDNSTDNNTGIYITDFTFLDFLINFTSKHFEKCPSRLRHLKY